MPERILTKHAPLVGAGNGGADLRARQQAALEQAQRVPGAGSADDVRLAVGTYLQVMATGELDATPGALGDLLGLLDDATAIAHERSAAAIAGSARDWQTVALALEALRSTAQQIETIDEEDDPR